MAYLHFIITSLEEHFSIKVQGNPPKFQQVDATEFLLAQTTPALSADPRILYIGNYGDYYGSFEHALILLLNAPDIPEEKKKNCFYITENLNPLQVFNVIQKEFLRCHHIHLKKEALFKSLQSGNGIMDMLHVAYSYLENPITVCDSSFCIRNACPETNDAQNLESKNHKLYLKEIFLKRMIDNKITEHIYHSKVPFLTPVDEYPYLWVFAGIRIQHSVVGYICIRGINRDFTEDDMEFVDILSQMLSIEMQKEHSFSNPTGLKYEYFLSELLQGHLDDTEFIHNRLVQLGHDPMPYYHVFILEFTNPSGRKPSKQYMLKQMLSMFSNCMVVSLQGHLTILLPSKTNQLMEENEKQRFATFLQLNQMYAAVSYPFSDLSKSCHYYQQTLFLLSLKNCGPDSMGFLQYKNHFQEHIFNNCNNPALIKAAIHPDILFIQSYDIEHHTEYLHTLRAYLIHNRNGAVAARELHIHKSTFFYRFQKLTELLQFDMNDSLLLWSYEYSLRILDYFKTGRQPM